MSILDKIVEAAFQEKWPNSNNSWLQAFNFEFHVVEGMVSPYSEDLHIFVGLEWLEKNLKESEMVELMVLRLEGKLSKQSPTFTFAYKPDLDGITKCMQRFGVVAHDAIVNLSNFGSSIGGYLSSNEDEVRKCLKQSQK